MISLRGTAYQSISKALFQNKIRKTELKNLVTLSYYHNQKCFNHAVIIRELDGFGTQEKNWITKSWNTVSLTKKLILRQNLSNSQRFAFLHLLRPKVR